MIRMEIIANHSVEENIFEALAKEDAGKYYTKYPNILGVGSTGPRLGDAVWPEENFALVIWCEEEESRAVERAIASVKEKFPGEGIKIFSISSLSGSGMGQMPAGRTSAATAAEPPPAEAPSPRVQLGPVGENI